jgi:hypothetical protein
MQSQRLRQTQDLKIHKIQNTKVNTEPTVIITAIMANTAMTTILKGKEA